MKHKHYVPAHKYSDRELLEAEIADMVTEIECAYRDHSDANPLLDYAARCSRKLAELQAQLLALP